jgi:pyrroline-5-carboxylate reductase
MRTIAFIGGGRVTRILVGGWRKADALPASILVHDTDDEAWRATAAAEPSLRRVSLEEAAAADVVFLALHPPAIGPVLGTVRPHLQPQAVVVSLAPKVTLQALEAGIGTSRLARMIPNAPSVIGQGFNPITYGPGLDTSARVELAALVAPWGPAPEVDESGLEAYAILTGMGPTYFWYQWDALRQVTRGLGLDPTAVDVALRAMVTGAVATLLDSGLSPDDVMDLVPVKPLAAQEPAMRTAYLEALPALHAKIHPAPALAGR